jgi:hypothetical protein
LKLLGFSAWPFWFDLNEIGKWRGTTAGLKANLAEGIDNSISMVSFVSPEYLNSDFCFFEWSYMAATSPTEPSFRLPVVWKEISPEIPSLMPEIFRLNYIRLENAPDILPAVMHSAAFLEKCRLRRWERWRFQTSSYRKVRLAFANWRAER